MIISDHLNGPCFCRFVTSRHEPSCRCDTWNLRHKLQVESESERAKPCFSDRRLDIHHCFWFVVRNQDTWWRQYSTNNCCSVYICVDVELGFVWASVVRLGLCRTAGPLVRVDSGSLANSAAIVSSTPPVAFFPSVLPIRQLFNLLSSHFDSVPIYQR